MMKFHLCHTIYRKVVTFLNSEPTVTSDQRERAYTGYIHAHTHGGRCVESPIYIYIYIYWSQWSQKDRNALMPVVAGVTTGVTTAYFSGHSGHTLSGVLP